MKYNRNGQKDRTTKVKNIPNRVSIHDRPFEATATIYTKKYGFQHYYRTFLEEQGQTYQ